MANVLELESTLTDRYQTTVPDAVRRTLKLRKRDKIRYVLQPNGDVLLTRADAVESDDPVVGKFLQFLAQDIESNPQRVKGLSASLRSRLRALTRGVKVVLEEPLDPADEE